jgi:hypothetical protein
MYRKWLFISILYAFIRYTFKCNLHQPQLKLNPLNLANCDLVFGPVVKFGGPGRLMRSHLLGMLEPAPILGSSGAGCGNQVGDPGGSRTTGIYCI